MSSKETITVKLDPIKPRNKQLNDVLLSRKNATHYNARTDYNRAKEKDKIVKGDEE